MERTAGEPSVDETSAWLAALRAEGATRDDAVRRLHELLLRAARYEVGRRRAALSHVRGEELDDIANQAADDALLAVLAKLDQFRGASRFTTWAYKFALLEAGVRTRRRLWQDRQVAIDTELTAHQRVVFVALALNEVPIDVLADRLNTNRNALYKTLHDARRKLRKHLDECGLALDDRQEER